ncbi:MAG TPA: tetratricopeptide repeat protein [Tepidisphaeraceae bacterium]
MSRVCANSFVDWDDAHTLYNNPRMNPPSAGTLRYYWTHGEYGLYIPATYTIWTGLAKVAQLKEADDRGIQLDARIFHTASVAIHALSAVALFFLLRRLLNNRHAEVEAAHGPEQNAVRDGAAALGALLFAVHPVQVESVGWTSGMKDLLYGGFAIVALWQYVAAVQSLTRRGAVIHYVIATLAFMWAVLCKPTAMVLPAVAVVIDLLILDRNWKKVARWTACWWPVAIGTMIVARLVQFGHEQSTAPLWTRPLVALDALAFYLRQLAWPAQLCIDYGRTPTAAHQQGWIWWTWLVPAAVAALLWWKGRKPHVAAALILAICVAPVLGLTPFLFQFYSTVSDHYLYLAMIGPALALAFTAATCSIARPAALIVLGLFAVKSFSQTSHWRDDEALFAHTVAVNPNSFVAYNNLGSAHSHLGDVLLGASSVANRVGDHATTSAYQDQAMQSYRRAKDLFAQSIDKRKLVNRDIDDYLTARGNLAVVCSRLHEHEQALAHLKAAERIVRRFFPSQAQRSLPDIYSLAGQDLLALNRIPEAIQCFDQALTIQPAHVQARINREKARQLLATVPLNEP